MSEFLSRIPDPSIREKVRILLVQQCSLLILRKTAKQKREVGRTCRQLKELLHPYGLYHECLKSPEHPKLSETTANDLSNMDIGLEPYPSEVSDYILENIRPSILIKIFSPRSLEKHPLAIELAVMLAIKGILINKKIWDFIRQLPDEVLRREIARLKAGEDPSPEFLQNLKDAGK